MTPEKELRRLITILLKHTRTIQLIAYSLEELQFPCNSPLILARLVAKIAGVVEKEILRQYRIGPLSVAAFIKEVKFVIRAMEELVEDLRYSERAVTKQTPWSLVRPLEKLGEKIYNDSLFILRPQWSYNYSLIERVHAYKKCFSQYLTEEHLDDVLTVPEGVSLSEEQPKKKRRKNKRIHRIFVIGFPYMERMNTLLHATLGHELGHPIEKEFFKDEDRNPVHIPPLLIELIKRKSYNGKEVDLRRQISKDLIHVMRIRRRALAELICDIVAVHLFGPAAVFAYNEMSCYRDLDAMRTYPPERHYPPWRFRLRVMLDELPDRWIQDFLRRGKFTPATQRVIREKLTCLRNLVQIRTDIDNIKYDGVLTEIAYDSVKNTLEDAKKFVRDRLENRDYRLDDLKGMTNAQLVKRLINFIPPESFSNGGEEEVICNIRNILNVGWIAYLKRYPYLPYKGGTPKSRDLYLENVFALNRLILKAIEFADLREVWNQRDRER